MRHEENRIRFPWKYLPLVVAFGLSGCRTVPFEKPVWVDLPDVVDARGVAMDFAARIPERFETENTLVFQFLWREIAVLGYAKVDRVERTFEVLCMNHMGVQLFHLSGDAQGSRLRYALPEFEKRPEFAEAVGEDIRAVYFDLVPGAGAEADVRSDRIEYSELFNDGDAREFVFGGGDLRLLRKRIRIDGDVIRVVSFYEYQDRDGRVYPGGIVLDNREYRYRLIIKTREMRFE